MLFVNLLYLAAAGAIAGPIALHLLLRQRPKRQTLPTLRFLTGAAPQSYAMHRFKNLMLLLARVAIVLLIALAFARPFIDMGAPADGEETAAMGMVVVLDTSFSMRAGDAWEEAQTRVRNALKTMPGDSPAALVTFDRSPRITVTETRDLSRIESELRVIEPGHAGTDLGAAIRAGAEAANKLNAHRTRVVVVSDYQRTAVRQPLAPIPVRAGVEIEPISVGANPGVNVAIASAQVIPGETPGKRNVLLEVRRYGEGGAEAEVELLAGASLGNHELNWNEGGQAFSVFEVDEPEDADELLEARVHTSDTPEGDNVRNVLLEKIRPIPLLVLEQTGRVKFASNTQRSTPAGVNRFVKAALDACEGLIDAAWSTSEPRSLADLVQYPVVLAVNVDAYDEAATVTLKSYVESGGALVLFPGTESTVSYASLTGSAIDGWNQLDRQSSEYRLVSTIRNQGPMNLLGDTGESVLGHPKVYRYLTVQPDVDNGAAAVAQFDDGAPFLIERRMGDGLVYAFTVPLDTAATDFVLRASFTPFLYELMAHATHETQAPREYVVGDGAPAPLLRGVETVIAPDGVSLHVAKLTSFAQPGAYTLVNDSDERQVAVNIDPLESDLARLNGAEIGAIRELGIKGDDTDDTFDVAAGDIDLPPDDSSKFWRSLLIAALVLIGIETVLASRTVR